MFEQPESLSVMTYLTQLYHTLVPPTQAAEVGFVVTNRARSNEENVRFFIHKLLDFGLSLLESPQI